MAIHAKIEVQKEDIIKVIADAIVNANHVNRTMRAFAFFIIFFFSCTQKRVENLDNELFENLDNSSLIITEDSSEYNLSRCQVLKIHDTIFLRFNDTSKVSNWYELEITKTSNDFLLDFRNTFSITDSSYKAPVFKIFYQNIQLDKDKYQVGDSIVGNVSLELSSFNSWPAIFTDTLKVKGSFRAIVK